MGELVGKVRTEFSGKAADRFAEGLERFDGLLSSGQGALGELAVFVRDLARQVRYLKLVTIYGLELLAVEMAWAVAWAGATGGASLAWLAARMAVMRLLLSRWWGQLFMRLAMAAAGGVAFNVVPDLQAQLQMLGEKSSAKWDGKLSEQAAGMGAFSALVSLPLSAVGGLVSNALTKVLVRGLGDEVDEKILEAAARKAVDTHAELYPVSAMARFADVVGDHLDVYAGMSVRGMWSARFGSGIGEALSEGLGELFGEVGYQAATGQEVTWNPFSVTAGVFESVFSGVGNLAGLVWRGKLHPEGPSPYLDDTSRREGTTTETTDGGGFGAEKAPLLGAGSGSQTGDIPGSPGKDGTFTPSGASDGSDGSKPSDVASVFPVGPVDSAAVSAPSGKDPVVSAVVDSTGGTDVKGGKDGADGSVPGGKPTRDVPVVPGSRQKRQGTPLSAYSDGVVGFGEDRQGTPPPVYSREVVGLGQDRQGTPLSAQSDGGAGSGQDRQDPPPPYSPVAGGDQVSGAHGLDMPGNRPLEVHSSQTPDKPAVTPHASGVPVGQPTSQSGMTGRDADSHVDSVAGHGDSHRLDVAAVSPDSATPSAEGAQVAPDPHQDPAAGVPAAVPAGVPVDAVRVPVPAEVVAGGGLAEFVRGGVADSTGGPVLLVAQGNPAAGVVVSPGQGSALAQGMGRDVVAVTPGQDGRGPQWTVFGADGSARPVAAPGASVPVGGHGGVAGLADASAAVPVGPAASGRAPVGQWSGTDLRGEIDRARDGRRSGDDESAARRIVQGTHDIAGLARGDAAVSLEDVVALVAAKHHELGDAHQDQVVEFSQALADRLGTQGSGLTIHAGAGPQPGRDMLRQFADDPGPATGEPRTRYVVHGDPGRKTDDTAHAGPGFAPVAHDLHDTLDRAHKDLPRDARSGTDDVGLTAPLPFLHVDGPARAEIWIQPGSDGVKPVPDTIQERRPKRDGARRRLSWPGSRPPGDTAPTTASGSSNVTSRASREAREIPSGPAPIRPQENTGQVTGRDGFAGFLGGYSDNHGVGSVGLSAEGTFGDPSPEAAVWPGAGRVVGSGFRFVRGVNQAGYLSGDARFRVNCLEACVAFHNSVKFGWQFVAGPAGDRDPVRLEVAFGRQARRVEGVAGVEQYVRDGPVGVAVPVLYQRADGSAHVINAVHTDSKDLAGRDVVVLWDPQRGEEAEKADVSAVTGMWVIPVPEAEPVGMVVLPSSGSGLRSQGWGSGLPTEVAGPKRQPGASGPEAGKTGPKGRKRTRAETGESSGGAKRRKVAAAAAGIDPGSPGNGESEVLTPTDQPAQQDERSARRKQQNRASDAKSRQAKNAAATRVVVLEELAGRGPLTEEQAAELAELQPKVAQQKQQQKEKNAKYRQARKAATDRVAELEELEGRGPLTEEQAAELAELQPKVAQQKQQKKERSAKEYQTRKAVADRVVVLEELEGQGPLTVEQAAELAEFQSKVARWKQQQKEKNAKRYQKRKAVAGRVVVLEELAGQGELTVEQEAELAELQPKVAQQKQQKTEDDARYHRAIRAVADRVEELEELAGQGELTEEQEAELAELQPKVAQQKQQKKEKNAKYHQGKKAAAARVVVLEELAGQGELTEEQAAELAELQPKVAEWKKQTKASSAKYHQGLKAAADRVAVLEELAEQGPLTEEQAAELAALHRKVAKKKEQGRAGRAKHYQGKRAEADRVVVLEELAGQGLLTEGQAAELAELQPKVAEWKQQEKAKRARRHQRIRAAADRVVVLEELAGRGS
ncbi:hypothetical protein [Saccharopolyspora spinosa]|uniref:hypothetical protein n=1 Tax=Saccharopolyspora spinosa TaxID=60894 RepID=UPI00374A5E46